MPPGNPYIFRTRSASDNPLIDVRNRLVKPFLDANDNFPEHYQNGEWIKRNVLFAGELTFKIINIEIDKGRSGDLMRTSKDLTIVTVIIESQQY